MLHKIFLLDIAMANIKQFIPITKFSSLCNKNPVALLHFHENVFMNKHQLCSFLVYSNLMLELQKQCRRTDRRKSLYISKETQQASSY